MGAPPPTIPGRTFNVDVTVHRRRSAGKRALENFWSKARGILLKYGTTPGPNGPEGTTAFGMTFTIRRVANGAVAYSIQFAPDDGHDTDLEVRSQFLGAYKVIRTALEELADTHGMYVNEWNDVEYGGFSLARRTGTGFDDAIPARLALVRQRAQQIAAATRAANRKSRSRKKKPKVKKKP